MNKVLSKKGQNDGNDNNTVMTEQQNCYQPVV